MATMRTLIGTDDVNYITPYFNTWKSANGLSYTLSTIADTTLIPTTVSSIKTDKGNDAIYRTKLTGTINIDTGSGNDIIVMNANNSSAQGQSGKDFVMGIGNNNFLHGGNDSDLVVAFGTSNFLHGGSGNDYLIAMAPNNIQGNNILSGDSGNDIMDVLQDFYATLQFNGLRSSYTITRSSTLDGTYTITGPDGTDTIIGHRSTTLKFDNMSIQLKGLFADRAPIAVLDTNNINEDAVAPVTGNVLTNDKDPDLDPIRVKTVDGTPVTLAGLTINTSPWGSLFIQQNGSYSFAVNHPYVDQLGAGDTQAVVFSYVIESQYFGPGSSPALFSSPTTLTITILGVNDPATITGTAIGAVQEDGTLSAFGLLSVSDPDAGENHFQTPGSLSGVYGDFSFNATAGSWSYALNNLAANVQALAQGQQVHDMLAVTSFDGTASQVIDVTITGTNDAPVALNDGQVATTNQNTGTTLPGSVFLANDTDKDNGHVLSIASVSGDSHISLVSGNVVFTPGTDFAHLAQGETATVNFSYIAKDEFDAQSGPATASIEVTGINDAPVANDDTVSPDIPDNEPTIILASSLLSNDTDVDNGDAALLYINSVGNAVNGTVALLLDGNIEFTPTSGYSGPASFTYTVSDTHPGGISVLPATVSFTVFIANLPPTAVDDNFPAVDDTFNDSSIALGNVLTNDTDPNIVDTKEVVSASYVEFILSSPVNLAGLGTTAIGSLSVAPTALVGVEKAHFLITPTGVLANEGGAEIPAELIIMEDGSVHLIKNNAFDFLPVGDSLTLKFSYTMEDSVGLQSTADLDITITGTDNKDVYIGAGTNNTLNGGSENDLLNGGLGTDTLLGGAGNDTLIFSVDGVWPSGQNFLNTFTGQLILVAGMNRSFDTYSGGSEYDILIGSSGNDGILRNSFTSILIPDIEEIHAGAGNDIVDMSSYTHITTPFILYGEAGNDVLWGEAGDDTLIGGSDNDSLDGGTGNDTFVFDVGGFGVDEITTYEIANDILNFINVPDVNSNMEDLDDLNDLVLSVTDSGLGGDVVITFNNGSSVTLTGIGTGSLNTLIALNNTINIQVNGVDIPDSNLAPPTAVDDTLPSVDDSFNESSVLLGNVLTNDTDPDVGDTKEVVSASYVEFVPSSPVNLAGLGATGSLSVAPTALGGGEKAHFLITPTGVLANDTTLGGTETPAELIIMQDGSVHLIKNNAFDFLPDGDSLTLKFTYTMKDSGGLQSTADLEISITGEDNKDVIVLSDTTPISIYSGVDDDILIAGSGNDQFLYGDDFDMSGTTRGSDDILTGGSGSNQVLHGDAFNLNDDAVGGNDILTAGTGSGQFLEGDSVFMNDNSVGGNDTLTLGSTDGQEILGESYFMYNNAVGGDDTITGGSGNGQKLTGDAPLMYDNSEGGDDIIWGGSGSNQEIRGDAYQMSSITRGGNDEIIAGSGANMSLFGDAILMYDFSVGGDDILTAGAGNSQELRGDAQDMSGSTQGGDDSLTGGSGIDQVLFGDAVVMFDSAVGGDDELIAGNGFHQTLYGDALFLLGATQGGNDILTSGGGGNLVLHGDAYQMNTLAVGGNDTLTLGSVDGQEILGESYYMYNNTVGGNDTITGGSGNGQKLTGDAVFMSDNSEGGDDIIWGGSGSNQEIRGDAYQMAGTTKGGNDLITAGNGIDQVLFGDAVVMFDSSVGGDDELIAGNGFHQTLYGDALFLSGTAKGGNDILTSGGGGNLVLHGDAYQLSDLAVGGNDTLTLGSVDGQIILGESYYMYNGAVGGDDTITGGSGNGQELRGDAYELSDTTQGGDDIITGGSGIDQVLFGDAVGMIDFAVGGDDELIAGSGFHQTLYGDALFMFGSTQGGNDIITSGSGSDLVLHGDAYQLSNNAVGGNDTLTLDSVDGQEILGDSFLMYDDTLGGDDIITGGSGLYQKLTGDTAFMNDNAVGGDDTITGGSGNVQELRGDAYQMSGNTQGGDDEIIAGSGEVQFVFGDARFMIDNAKGGNDIITVGSGFAQQITGDADEMSGNAIGGNDTITGVSGSGQEIRGDAYIMYNTTQGGNDIIAAGSGSNQELYGDANIMLDNTQGGNDSLTGGSGSDQLLFGDANDMSGSALGGNDTITASSGMDQALLGDALIMLDTSQGGDDSLTGGSGSGQLLFGDANSMFGFAVGGDDTFIGGSGANQRHFGDANSMSGSAQGGNDILTAGSGNDQLYGDAGIMSDSTQGGDDILTAGSGLNQALVGDAITMEDFSVGGNDTLISGINNDLFYGDAFIRDLTVTTGADTFVFDVSGFGDDTVGDFEASKDILNFVGVPDINSNMEDLADLAALVASVTDAGVGGNVVVNFINGSSVTLTGIGTGSLNTLNALNNTINIQVNGVDIPDGNFFTDDILSPAARGFVDSNTPLSPSDIAALGLPPALSPLQYSLSIVSGFVNVMNNLNPALTQIPADTTNGDNHTVSFASHSYNLINGPQSSAVLTTVIGTSLHDLMIGGVPTTVTTVNLIGDANSNSGALTGGIDVLIGGSISTNDARYNLYGDVNTNSGASANLTGGNDILIGGDNNNGIYSLYGDALQNSSATLTGGNDILIGGDNNSSGQIIAIYSLYGDVLTNTAGTITTAGNDILYGGAGIDTLVGDARANLAGIIIKAGDDQLYGGAGNDNLVGDVLTNTGTITTAGTDRLDGGAGNDTLVGDVQINTSGTLTTAGNDTFVFSMNGSNGNDTILDMNFGGVNDILEFSGVGITSIADINDASTFSDSGGHVLMTFDAGGSVLFSNIAWAGQTSITDITPNVGWL